MSKFKEMVEQYIEKVKSEEPNCEYDIYEAIEDIIKTLPDYDRGYMSSQMSMYDVMGLPGKEIFYEMQEGMNAVLGRVGIERDLP